MLNIRFNLLIAGLIWLLLFSCSKAKPHAVSQKVEETLDFSRDPSVLSVSLLNQWKNRTAYSSDQVTWQIADIAKLQTENPLSGLYLPGKETLELEVSIRMSKNEGESVAIFVINPSKELKKVPISFKGFNSSGIEAEIHVAGLLTTKRLGNTFRPLFNVKNKISADRMEKYLLNSTTIKDFPTLNLSPGGTALLWLTIHTDNARTGNYNSHIGLGSKEIKVGVDVQAVELPRPDAWIHAWQRSTVNYGRVTWNSWGNDPNNEANMTREALEKELLYMQRDLGINVGWGLPEADTDSYHARVVATRFNLPQPKYRVWFDDLYYMGLGFRGQLNEANLDKPRVATIVKDLKTKMENLNLTFDDVHLELWDEPKIETLESWVLLARAIKEEEPRFKFFLNPVLYRDGHGFLDDDIQRTLLDRWYNELVDVSAPVMDQYKPSLREFYNYPGRDYNATYIFPCPGRWLSWDAFKKGFNGYGFYSYYDPMGSAWDDFDNPEFADYTIVYPGLNGFIPTIHSESMRESYEDYRLLTLLKQQNKTMQLDQVFALYKDRDNSNLERLREMLMDAVSGSL